MIELSLLKHDNYNFIKEQNVATKRSHQLYKNNNKKKCTHKNKGIEGI